MSSSFEWGSIANGPWLMGLALILAAAGFTDYRRAVQPLPWREAWHSFTSSRWTLLGLVLFSLGMSLTAGSLLERALWGLLGLYAIVMSWRAAGGRRTSDDRPRTTGRTLLRGIPRTPFDWSIALLMLMALVSVFVTPDTSLTLPGVAALMLGIAAYYALVIWMRADRPERLALAAFAYATVGGGVLAVFALLSLNAPAALALPGGGANPNQIGGALALVIPMQMALLPRLWADGVIGAGSRALSLWAQRALLLTVLAASLGALLLTQSRGALAGLYLGIFLLVWLSGSRLRVWALAGLAAAAVVLLYISTTGAAPQLTELFDPRTLGSRANIWANSLHAIEDFPITGVGMNGFRRLMPLMYPTFSPPPASATGYAHNDLLQAALDLGLPGLVAYMAIWVVALGLVVSAVRRPFASLQQAFAAGISACLLAYFVFGIIDAIELGSGLKLPLWILLALLITLTRQPAMDRV